MNNQDERKQEFTNWYNSHCDLYRACCNRMKELISNILHENKAAYHSIDGRLKTQKSFIKKCLNDKYKDPTAEITDLCGLRIITYTNTDVQNISKILKSEFKIDEKNTIDKSELMSDDQVGYLSVHYVVTINDKRSKLAEYKAYANLKFEIQVRTLLQHAWAEIEHDRNYKFSGELPHDIKRRFYLVAGTLELLDREFERLSDEIDDYAAKVKDDTEKGQLDVAIDSTSLTQYLSVRLKDFSIQYRNFNNGDKRLISELQAFGINTLQDLDKIIDDEFVKNHPQIRNYIGLLRDFMIINDPDKYFKVAWQNHWEGCDLATYQYLVSTNPRVEKYKSIFMT